MKKIFCDIHLFSMNQKIYIVNPEEGKQVHVGTAVLEGLPGTICALSKEYDVKKVILGGNSILGNAIAEDIHAFAKMNYSNDEIEVEVLK